MAFNLKQALEFNKSTMALAAAGFGYISNVAAQAPDLDVRIIGLVAVVAFAVSTIFGLLVVGRASKLEEGATDDALIRSHGQWHTLLLIVGLIISALFFVIGIARGPVATPAEASKKTSAVVATVAWA